MTEVTDVALKIHVAARSLVHRDGAAVRPGNDRRLKSKQTATYFSGINLQQDEPARCHVVALGARTKIRRAAEISRGQLVFAVRPMPVIKYRVLRRKV
jgi:hypothetical protein